MKFFPFVLLTLMPGCSHSNLKNSMSSSDDLDVSFLLKHQRSLSSVASPPYDGSSLIRRVLHKASIKYHKKSVVEHPNSKLFSNRLTSSEKKQLEFSYPNPTSKAFTDLTLSLGRKYQRVLDRNLEQDENYNDVSELNLYIFSEINKLFYMEEVQKELIESVFTADRKEKLFNYFNFVKRSLLKNVTPKIDNRWLGQISFYELVLSTKLFWPDFNYLKPFYKEKRVRGKRVRALDDSDSEGAKISEIYLRYLKQGYSYYTGSNASFGYVGYVDSSSQAMLIQPVFVAGIKNETASDFSILGILAHELGHGAGYFSRQKYEENYKPTVEEIKKFENEVLLPFYQCYTSGKNDLEEAKIQYQETRSDFIAHIVMKDIKDSLNLKDDSLYVEMINTFRKFTSEKIREAIDPHPLLKDREKIVSGQCQLKTIYPFTNYNESL